DADSTEQNPERCGDGADHLLAKRLHHGPVTLHDLHVWSGPPQTLLDPARERFKLRRERRRVGSRFHPRDHARSEPARRDLRGTEREVDPERHALVRKAEVRLHHPDDRPWLAREGVALVEYRLVGIEPILKEPVADNNDFVIVLV